MIVLPFLLAALLLAVAVHFASILAMPALTTNDLHSRLAWAQPNVMTLLTPAQIAQLRLPFYDSAFETAVCRYNLREGVLRVRAPTSDTLLLVTLVNRGGSVFFAVTDRGAVKGSVEALIGTDAQIQQIEDADDENATVSELRVRAPSPDGVALVRALAPDRSSHTSAAATVGAATCAIETL